MANVEAVRPLVPGVDFDTDMAVEHGHGWERRRCNVLVLSGACPGCGANELTTDAPVPTLWRRCLHTAAPTLWWVGALVVVLYWGTVFKGTAS